jgi:Cyclin, C-terminal domain
MEDRNPPLQEDFVYISDQSVSSGMLRRFEKRICQELNFNLHRLTPIHYANSFLRASNACPCLTCPFDHPVLRQLFLYLIELARIPIALVDCPPSLVAAAAVYLGRATLGLREENPGRQAVGANDNNNNNNCYWTKTLQHYTGYSVEDLKDPVLRIYEYQLQAEQLAIAPYIKFRSRARLQVSLKTVLRIEDLGLFGINNNATTTTSMGLNHDTLPLVTA